MIFCGVPTITGLDLPGRWGKGDKVEKLGVHARNRLDNGRVLVWWERVAWKV